MTGEGRDVGSFPLHRSEADWRRALTRDRFGVLRRGKAEPAFSSPLGAERRRGTYACAGCGQDGFSSAAKLDDGSGWPAFGAVLRRRGRGRGPLRGGFAATLRAAVRRSRCGGHLGTLSRDAPTPTGLHYRIDGLALAFTPAASPGAASS